MNNTTLAIALFTEPARAFAELDARPRSAFPLLLLLVVSAAMLGWYYSQVDLAWLLDATLRNSPAGARMTEEQIALVAESRSGPVTVWSSVIAIAVFVLLSRLLEAVWYLLAGKVTNVERSFRHWFALGCWTSLPQVVATLAAAPVLLLATTRQLDAGAISPLSLNELFFQRAMGDPGYSFLTNVNLLHFVGLALAVYGVRQWSRRSWGFASVFVLLPPVLIFGTWGWFSMVRP